MTLLLLALLLHRPTSPHVAPPLPTVTAAPAARVPLVRTYRPWVHPPRSVVPRWIPPEAR